MYYTDLVLLKALFNRDLHNAIVNKNKAKIQSIMRSRYMNDINMHNIVNFYIDCEQLKIEHENNLQEDLSWAL